MSSALLGFLVVFGFLHLLLIAIPLVTVLRASISIKSKIIWSAIVVLLPILGVAIMHFRYRIGLFHGKAYEISAAEERARSGTLAPDERDQ